MSSGKKESGLAPGSPPVPLRPVIDLNKYELLERYVTACPSHFGKDERMNSKWLKTTVLQNKELLTFPLNELNKIYFNDKKLEVLSSHVHRLDEIDKESITLSNATFFVTIGLNAAYKAELDKPKANNKPSPPDGVSLKGKGLTTKREKTDYQDFFIDFYNGLFKNDERDKLLPCFQKENMLSICIFARTAHTTPTKILRFNDQLIAAASFTMDEIDSLLLSWIGVLDKKLNELSIHNDFKENKTSLCKKFNLGTFLISLCQVFKSTVQKMVSNSMPSS